MSQALAPGRDGFGIGQDLRTGVACQMTQAPSGEACVAPAPPNRESGSWKRDRGDKSDRVDCVRMVHKTVNVLNKVPKSVQRPMKADLREISGAPIRADAEV